MKKKVYITQQIQKEERKDKREIAMVVFDPLLFWGFNVYYWTPSSGLLSMLPSDWLSYF